MGATTATAIITGALDLIGVIQPGQAPGGDDIADSYRRLQNMMGSLAIQPKTIPVVAREVFPLVAGKGGPSNPYTMGPGGDFDTSRPNALDGAGLLMPDTPNSVEIPRTVYTDDGYAAVQIKDLQSSMFTGVYYNATFALGLGEVNLWPVPNTTLNSLVLYRLDQLGRFASLTATYYVPDGYDEMLEYNLAMRLAGPYRVPLPPYVQQMAVESLAIVKRANYRLTEVPTDSPFVSRRRYGYNIVTGQ